jgi:hypothetical protein
MYRRDERQSMAEIQASRGQSGPDGRAATFAKVTHITGALISMGLLIGIGQWGYGVVVRDVSGIPVVRAVGGPMREPPDEPGGHEAAHQGLSVNRVAAQASTAEPPERVIIAPSPLDLRPEDIPRAASSVARAPVAARAGDVHLAVARQPAPAARADPAPEPQARSESGLGRSLRPRLRPALPDPVAYAIAAATSAPPVEVDPDSLPQGARLAQLGAFDSAEVARAEWERLSTRLGDLLDGKRRVVQRAESGGRTFYRLRAVGFDGLDDARRFCSPGWRACG